MDDKHRLDPVVIKEAFKNKFMSVEVPSQYEGPNLNLFHIVLLIEELAKVDPSVAIFCHIQNTLVIPLILKYGFKEQKQKYLSKVTDNWIGCFCLTEESSGSDAFSLKVHAKQHGDDFILNGSKLWITNAEHANFFLLMANADPSQQHKGITCFLVDRAEKGVSVGKNENKLGIRASSTCPVVFEDVRVPKSAILGEFGKGYKYAMETLNIGRIGIGAQMLGLAQGCFDRTMEFLQQSYQEDKKRFIDFQDIQHQVAEMATDLEAARLMVYNTARMKENGQQIIKHASMAKFFSANMATRTTSRCIDMISRLDPSKIGLIEKFYRDCKIGTIYGGTSNIQLNTIARLIDDEYRLQNSC